MSTCYDTSIRIKAAIALLLALPISIAHAQSAIYRCHALNGDLQFQDKPCNAATNTQEAQVNREGEVVAPAAPAPLDVGTSAVERYTRYLDFVSRDRREQAAVDAAETSRLRAQAEADRAAASTVVPFQSPAACTTIGVNGECLSTEVLPYAVVLPPVHRYNGRGYEHDYGHGRDSAHRDRRTGSPAPTAGSRSVALNPRTPRDPRAEILSLAPQLPAPPPSLTPR